MPGQLMAHIMKHWSEMLATALHLENFSLNCSSSSLVIRVNLQIWVVVLC